MQAQWETWDREWVPECTVVYYTGKGLYLTHGHVLCPHDEPVSDEYYQMHWKFKKALDGIDLNSIDFIFRTNSSSYINKEKLLKHAETLPKERLYSGWSLGEKEAVSGAGIWLSPDMVEILREEIPPGEQIEEDILIGRILHKKHGVEILDDKSRFDVTDPELAPIDSMHYRFKTSDRLQDIRNIYHLHQRIKK
jgi:hypothetical protein